MLAAYHGHAPLVKLLLQHGADPNSLNDGGQSPLAGAVFKGEPDVIEVRALTVVSIIPKPFAHSLNSSLYLLFLHPITPEHQNNDRAMTKMEILQS